MVDTVELSFITMTDDEPLRISPRSVCSTYISAEEIQMLLLESRLK